MSVFASPRFLRNVLWADAFSGAASSALHLAAAGVLSSLLGISTGLLWASGVALVVYVALAAYLATCEPIPRGAVWLLIVGNWAWALGCVVLLLSGAATTPLGQAYLVMQAVAVAALAELEWMGVRRYPVTGWA